MTLLQSIRRTLIILASVVLSYPADSSAGGKSMSVSTVNRIGIVAVQLLDSLDNPVKFGTGVILTNYDAPDSLYLLTACHVLSDGHKVKLLKGGDGGSVLSVLRTPVPLRDSAGAPVYHCYTTHSGIDTDLAILSIPSMVRASMKSSLLKLTRSSFVLSDSVFVGDRLLAIGFAKPSVFEFVSSGRPLATSGIVAFETDISYVLDTKTHPGMSGGIVFKVVPAAGEFGYLAAGIVCAGLSKYPDYSWVTKLDFLDSLLIDLTGKPWGAKE